MNDDKRTDHVRPVTDEPTWPVVLLLGVLAFVGWCVLVPACS